MRKYANIIGMVIGAVAGAIVFSLIEDAAALPWWFSEVGFLAGGVVGYIAGYKIAQNKQGQA